MDRYSARINLHGETRRERKVNIAKDRLSNKLADNLSTKNVIVNGEEVKLVINSGTKPYYKKFTTFPNQRIYPGELVHWNDTIWLVLNADFDSELYVDGNLQQCNFKLRWQNKNNQIIERDIVTISATAYNSGVEDKALITIGYDQLMIYIPYDEETIELNRDKRFFISNNKKKPIPYKLTSINTTSNIYNGHGYLQLIVSEDVLQEEDNVELGLCNYKESNSSDTPTNDLSAKIVFKSLKIKSGYSKGTTFSAEFYNHDIKQTDISPIWNVNCSFLDKLTVKEDGDKITLLINDDSYIGQRINLTLKDKEGNYQEDSILLEVTGLF